MADSSAIPGRRPDPAADEIVFVAALASERRALAGQAGRSRAVSIVQSGPGFVAARAAARAAVERGARRLVSWGLAGGLVAAATPGTVLLPERLVGEGRPTLAVDEAWRGRIAARLPAALGGALAIAATPITTPAAKNALGGTLGAIAVDMESYAVAEVAAAASLPFVAIRVVVDSSGDSLPADVADFVSARGNVRPHRVLLSALRAGANVRSIGTMSRRSAVAQKQLRTVARTLAATDFCRRSGEEAR